MGMESSARGRHRLTPEGGKCDGKAEGARHKTTHPKRQVNRPEEPVAGGAPSAGLALVSLVVQVEPHRHGDPCRDRLAVAQGGPEAPPANRVERGLVQQWMDSSTIMSLTAPSSPISTWSITVPLAFVSTRQLG